MAAAAETFCNIITSVLNIHSDVLKIYPNPAGDKLFVELPESLAAHPFVVEVRDIIGRQILQIRKEGGVKIIAIGLTSFPEGVYLLRLEDEQGGLYFDRFVKE